MDPQTRLPPDTRRSGLPPLLADVLFLLGYALIYLTLLAWPKLTTQSANDAEGPGIPGSVGA